MMKGIIDYKRADAVAVPESDMYVVTNRGQKKFKVRRSRGRQPLGGSYTSTMGGGLRILDTLEGYEGIPPR
jgi:hypothetical protein